VCGECISCLSIKAVCFLVICKMLATIYGEIKMSDDDDDSDVDNLTTRWLESGGCSKTTPA